MERRVRIGVNSKIWRFEKYEDYVNHKHSQPFGKMPDSWPKWWKVWRYAERLGFFGAKTDFGKSNIL